MPSPKNPSGKPRILVAPLDWGLGHATRCIPVIYELLAQNVEVWLAGEGAQETLLTKEFPALPFLHLQGYRVKYARTGAGLLRTLLFQLPALKQSIKRENEWLKQMVKEHGFDAVISDNRFGLYHSSVPSIFITHQLRIKSPFGNWTETILQKSNYKFINHFTACWVPDHEFVNDLAGELSHPQNKPTIPIAYTGFLSRLKKTNVAEKKDHLFISLSGPEPQRSLLEDKLVNQLSHYNGTATVVRGLPDNENIIPSTNDIRFYNHLPTDEYGTEMEKAEYVISRSGYSTVMDLATLGKKSILIPTPGQTEQEYLAKYLEEKQIACSADQKSFLLNEVLEKAKQFVYKPVNDMESSVAKTVSSLLSTLSK
ncbi:MAG: glycosyltransferase [Chitinophagaceae bacterium]